MNRIRKVNNAFQVLITPSIKIAPDSALMVGNWEDENLRNYHVVEFSTLNDAMCEAYKHPDIDWYRLIVNHEHIYRRLNRTIQSIIEELDVSVELKSNLMDPETFKNAMFDRVLNGGERFNLRYAFTDIISFTIINPWSNVLHKISNAIEQHREHLYRDDLRIRQKKLVDGKIICLYGYTEFGTVYEIKLVPTLLQQWGDWMRKNVRNQRFNYNSQQFDSQTESLFQQLLEQQKNIDSGPVLI